MTKSSLDDQKWKGLSWPSPCKVRAAGRERSFPTNVSGLQRGNSFRKGVGLHCCEGRQLVLQTNAMCEMCRKRRRLEKSQQGRLLRVD